MSEWQSGNVLDECPRKTLIILSRFIQVIALLMEMRGGARAPRNGQLEVCLIRWDLPLMGQVDISSSRWLLRIATNCPLLAGNLMRETYTSHLPSFYSETCQRPGVVACVCVCAYVCICTVSCSLLSLSCHRSDWIYSPAVLRELRKHSTRVQG